MNMNLYLGFRKAANFNYLDAVQRIKVKKYKLGLLGKSHSEHEKSEAYFCNGPGIY
jgi:hypothetical protein